MSLIIELLCNACNSCDCSNHIQKTFATDKITGLEFEIRCICDKHGDEDSSFLKNTQQGEKETHNVCESCEKLDYFKKYDVEKAPIPLKSRAKTDKRSQDVVSEIL